MADDCGFLNRYRAYAVFNGVRRLIPPAVLLCIRCCIFPWTTLFGVAVQPSSQDSSVQEKQIVKPESVQGCYELTLSEWRPNVKLGDDAREITPPHRIQLLSERGTQGWEAEGYIVQPAPGVTASVHRGSYWRPKGPQSVEIVWTTGFSGLVMGLRVQGDALRGTAKSFWDFPRKKQTADVVARKVDCHKP